jgi:anaphase-promoting complex subunit 1
LVLEFGQNDALREKFRHGDPSIYLRRKAIHSASGSSSVFASTLTGLSEAQDILPSTAANASAQFKGTPPSAWPNRTALLSGSGFGSAATTTPSQSPWDWIFQLPSLSGLDIRERSLVLPSSFPTRAPLIATDPSSAPPWLRTSAVDARLALSHTVRNIIQSGRGRGADPDQVRDRIWQLRLLFDWLDHSSPAAENVVDSLSSSSAAQPPVLWLRRDFVEEARWLVWGVQVGDSDGPVSTVT